MAFSIITHNNKEVLFINHRGLSGDDLYESYKAVNLYMLEKKVPFLSVADFTDTTGSQKLNEYIQSEETKATSKYIKKLAVVGMTGIKKMVLRVFSVFTGVKSKMFDSVEEALDYVTGDKE